MAAYLEITNNSVYDHDSLLNIKVEHTKYDAATARLVIEDDEFPDIIFIRRRREFYRNNACSYHD